MGLWIGKGQKGQRGLHGSLDREGTGDRRGRDREVYMGHWIGKGQGTEGPGTERSTWVIG